LLKSINYKIVIQQAGQGMINIFIISPVSGVLQNFEGGGGVNPPPQNSEVLTKLSQIPISVENTSVTT
jgi:hypothetical protein